MDTIKLNVDGYEISNFTSYSVDSEMFSGADEFSFETSGMVPDIIKVGKLCTLSVNGRIELTGIINRVATKYDKGGISATISGRDLIGLLCDHHTNDFAEADSLNGVSLKALALRLMRDVPFIKKSDVIFEDGSAGMIGPPTYGCIEPGATVFGALKHYASHNGLIFYSSTNGKLIFGKPKSSGNPLYGLTCRRDGFGNNIMSGSHDDDISGAYSVTTVQAQSQFGDTDSASRSIKGFPFFKPMITQANTENPSSDALQIVEEQRASMKKWSYTVAGHSSNGNNYSVNTIVTVDDDIFGTHEALLIYGRTYKLSKSDGVTTELKLGALGLKMGG